MFSSGLRRLSQLGTAVGSGAIVTNSVVSEVLNEACAPVRSQPRVLRSWPQASFDDYNFLDVEGEVSEPEIAAALDTIVETPDMLLTFLPPELVKAHPTDALKLVQAVLKRPDVIALAKSNLAKRNGSIATSNDSKPLAAPTAEVSAAQMWQQLRNKYPCVLCQDVLAAPTLMDCTHTLCGSCAEDLLTRCVPCDPNNDGKIVLVSCPSCRAEVASAPRYERLLDQTIEEAVRSVPACAERAEWEQRRAAHLQLMEQRRVRAAQAAKKANASSSNTSAHALVGDPLRVDVELDFQSFDVPGYATELSNWAVAIGFLVIVIVGVLRHR